MSRTLIFIPTYNERENVTPMCEQLLALPIDADVLFVDDGSPDGTGDVLDSFAVENPKRVHVIHRASRLGIGSAHLDGIAYAYDHGYDKLVTMDCDFSHAPSDVPMMLERSREADVTIASRYMQEDSLPDWTLARQTLTKLGHVMTEHVLGIPNDATGAFRVYDLKRIPRGMWSLVTAHGYAFFFESLFILRHNVLRLLDVPIRLPARTYGHSKMNVNEIRRSVSQLFRLYAAAKSNPAQFSLPKDDPSVNPELVDGQGWNEYWGKKSDSKALAYEVIAAIYRNLVIRPQLDGAILREFPKKGARLLHAGCGSGQVDVHLHDHAEITAVDISIPALRLYRRENPNVHDVRHASIFDLPFDDASFDGAYNLGVVEHFTREEVVRALRELRRVVRTGGKLVIFWPHALATSAMVLDSVHWAMNDVLHKDVHLHPAEISRIHSKKEATDILAEAGLALSSYEFGPRDFFVQAVVVADRV